MGVASALGVEDLDGPAMTVARAAWYRWRAEDEPLAVVEELIELRGWLKQADPPDRDGLLAALTARAHEDQDAATAVAWLLVPGAIHLADKLSDLTKDIDAMVAAQLWIEIRSGKATSTFVASTILRNVDRAVKAELGIGDAARREDPTWAASVVTDEVEAFHPPVGEDFAESDDALRVVITAMLEEEDSLSDYEAYVVTSAADQAEWLGKPMRGRAGMTAPESLERLTWLNPSAARTMRRTVVELMDRITARAKTMDVAELVKALPDDGLTLREYLMTRRDPKMAGRFQKTHDFNRLALRCRDLTWDVEAASCTCRDTGQPCALETSLG